MRLSTIMKTFITVLVLVLQTIPIVFAFDLVNVPSAPANPLVSSISIHEMNLVWDAPRMNSESVTDYKIRFSKDGGDTWSTFNDGVSTARSMTINELENGIPYLIQIQALSTAASSPWVSFQANDSEYPEQVEAHGDSTCIRYSTGNLKCWGFMQINQPAYRGEVLNGFTSTTPIKFFFGIPGLCRITENKDISCREIQVPSNFGLTNIVEIDSAGTRYCALNASGRVWCWGDGGSYQFGSSDTSTREFPVQISGLENIVSISTGLTAACAVTSTRQVKCWGYGEYGSLGNGGFASSSSAVLVQSLSNVESVKVAAFHACALVRDGKVKCWGFNAHGQLGIGTDINQASPATVLNLSNVIQISSNWDSSCAVKSSGDVFCWGSSTSGNIGQANSSLIPIKVEGISNAISISSGGSHSCVIESNLTVKCWGSNNYGKTGKSQAEPLFTPHAIVSPAPPTFSLPNLPTTPTSLIVDGTSSTFIELHWDSSTGDGYGIDKYQLRWSTDGTNWNSQDSISTSFSIQNLRSSTEYRVQVRAHSEVGWSDWSQIVLASTDDSLVSLLNPEVTSRTSTSMQISTSVQNSNQISIDSYILEWSVDGTSWDSREAQTPLFQINNLEAATCYFLRIGAHFQGYWDSFSDQTLACTSGTKAMPFSFLDSNSSALNGGEVSWELYDNSYYSAKSYGVALDGTLLFPRVAAGQGQIIAEGLVTEDGAKISGHWDVTLGLQIDPLTIPPIASNSLWKIRVLLPNGLPIANAVISISGLVSSGTQDQINFKTSLITSGYTDEDGYFTGSGFANSSPSASISYNDGVLVQNKSVGLSATYVEVQLDEMPWLEVVTESKTANIDSLVSVVVSSSDSVALSAIKRKVSAAVGLSSAGVKVQIIPPKGATQKCKGKVLKATTNQSGFATLKICATKSGIFKIKSSGAASTGAFTLKVRGAAPLPVSNASAVSVNFGEAIVAWNSPIYTGGAKIKNYVVTLKGGGKTFTKTVTKKLAVFKKLKNATTYTATIVAVTTNGKSGPVSVRVGVV